MGVELDRELVERLRRHVDLLAGVIGPRDLSRPAAFHAAAGYVERELAAAGAPITRERYQAGGEEVSNVCLEIPGSRRAAEIVVVGAHYDTVRETPGADDNASAVAALIEVARLLRGERQARTVRYVAFACEEPPYFHTGDMGSQHHARGCRQRNERIVGMICLEMVGFFSDEPGSQGAPDGLPRLFRGVLPTKGDFLAAVGNLRSARLVWRFRRGFRRATDLPLFAIALPESIREIRLSDNSSFWDQGYPALMVTDTSFLRNPHYHQASDTPETLDYERLARGVLGVAGAVRELAG